MLREMCHQCGTVFELEAKGDGTVGRVEGVRWIRLDAARARMTWRRRGWFRIAAVFQDLSAWASKHA